MCATDRILRKVLLRPQEDFSKFIDPQLRAVCSIESLSLIFSQQPS